MNNGKSSRGGGGFLMPLVVLGLVAWFIVDYQGFEAFAIQMADRFEDLVRALGDHLETVSAR